MRDLEILETKNMKTLPQYHYTRDKFILAFKSVFTVDEIVYIECACQGLKFTDSYHLYYAYDEFYISHLESGVTISWYKHLGRSNTCNNEHFNLGDLHIFLRGLKSELFNNE